MRKTVFALMLVLAVSMFTVSAMAADEAAPTETPLVAAEAPEAAAPAAAPAASFDFLRFAVEKVLPDFHPTVKLEDASAEYDKDPAEADGILSARVRMFYKGWIRKHEMMSQIDIRQDAGLVKVTVLVDSNGTNLTGSKIFKENTWVELSSLNWN